jgi:hypothetical protein
MKCTPMIIRSAAVASLLALIACGGAQLATQTSSDVFVPQIEPPSLHVGGCFDPSASVDPTLVSAGLDALAAAIREVPVAGEQAAGARMPVAGLDIALRQVSSNSLSSVGDELITVKIPGVPGLVDPPDPAEFATFPEKNRLWRQAQDEADHAMEQARAARTELLADLSALKLTEGGSEIAGCLTALRDSFPVGVEIVAVLVSDLQQTGKPQIRGDYSGMRLLVGHTCTDVDACAQAESEWGPLLEEMGVASVGFVSIGQLDDELRRLLEVES